MEKRTLMLFAATILAVGIIYSFVNAYCPSAIKSYHPKTICLYFQQTIRLVEETIAPGLLTLREKTTFQKIVSGIFKTAYSAIFHLQIPRWIDIFIIGYLVTVIAMLLKCLIIPFKKLGFASLLPFILGILFACVVLLGLREVDLMKSVVLIYLPALILLGWSTKFFSHLCFDKKFFLARTISASSFVIGTILGEVLITGILFGGLIGVSLLLEPFVLAQPFIGISVPLLLLLIIAAIEKIELRLKPKLRAAYEK